MYSVLYTAGNFAGKSFCELVKVEHFANKKTLHIANWSLHTKFTDKTFAEGGNAVKSAKVFTHESLQLYSILCQWRCTCIFQRLHYIYIYMYIVAREFAEHLTIMLWFVHHASWDV